MSWAEEGWQARQELVELPSEWRVWAQLRGLKLVEPQETLLANSPGRRSEPTLARRPEVKLVDSLEGSPGPLLARPPGAKPVDSLEAVPAEQQVELRAAVPAEQQVGPLAGQQGAVREELPVG